MTISSSAAFPALSPIPFIVHSTCLAPAEIPAKAFFQHKKTNVHVTKHPLIVYPTFFAAMLTIVLFIYIEPLKDITNLISGNQ